MFIRDEAKGLQLTVLADRSVGASSIEDGQAEMMLHRRQFNGAGDIPMNDVDIDGKGVVTRGRMFVFLSTNQETDNYRQLSQDLFMQPVVAFYTVDQADLYK